MKIFTQPVLIIKLKFNRKRISHIKNGYAIQGTKARNSLVTTTNDIASIKIDMSFKGIQLK